MDCLHPAIKSPILCNSDQCIGTQHINVEQPMKPHEITENGYHGSMESEVREINHDEKIGTLTGTQKGLELEPQAAAVAMQKAYRGYRTRRNLADCAIAVANGYESYGWWNVLEGALLKQSTIYAGPQNAAGRWVRLKKKAAKVGRGLSKDENARKLAFQHWLEAIDPRHRYGHNLHYYYDVWLKSQTQEPFFYWLDVGEGRDVDLEACPRSKLQKEQIMYLGPKERKHYEVVINEDGKLNFKQSGDLVHTPDEDDKWIFVLSPTGKLYVGQKEKGRFQHSSFLAGGAATAAGRLIVKDGVLQLMEAHSGHYRPTEENFRMLIEILKQNGADLKVAKVETVSDEMRRSRKSGSLKKAGSLKKTGSLKKSVSLKKKNSELSEAIKVEEVSMLTTTISGNDMEVKLDVHQDGVTSSPEMQSPEMQTLAGNDNQVETLSIDNAPLVVDAAANSTWRALEPENKERIIGRMFSHPLISPRYLPSKPLVGKPTLRKIESLKWSSGTGPRLSSLGDVPSDIRSRAWEALQSPRPKLPKTPPAFTMPTLIMQSN